MKFKFFCIAVAMTAGMSLDAQNLLPYQNPNLTPQQRAEDLTSRLSLEQKVSLMRYTSNAIPEFGIHEYNWWNEALHGAARAGLATVFPQAIGMAASFDDGLLRECFDIASTEQRIKFAAERKREHFRQYHGLTVWTPNINIFRDPRWGRGQETYGEDPYLTTRMGYSVVMGLQGDGSQKYDKLHACLKHFAVHSGPESERHIMDVTDISYRDLMETYLYAFGNLVRTTDVKEVMCAYNRFEGMPCCGSDKLLTQILRNNWGYKGLVVSDCWAIRDFYTKGKHNIFPNDPATSTALAVRSGTDVECGESFPALIDAVKQGKISEKEIDISVIRLLKARFELGEMDDDSLVSWNQIDSTLLACEAHNQKALQMARETMTLLQNRGKLLPLSKDIKVAVLGPNADDEKILWGNYNGTPSHTVSILEGIKAKIGEGNVIYDPCCLIATPRADKSKSDFSHGNAHDNSVASATENGKGSFDIDSIKDADVIIFVGGISPRLEGEQMSVKYEGFNGGDRTSIELPAPQREMIAKLSETGKPVVLVNLSGSAMALKPESANCDAILQAWYGGQEAGTAVADVLFGDYNPAGRLPVTFYASDNDLPDFHDYNMAGHTYRYFTGKPLFAFGHGLSYSKFRYGRARRQASEDGLKLSIPVKNASSIDGDEVVQVYVKRVDDVDGPVYSLRGFKRQNIKAGDKANVELTLGNDAFAAYDETAGDLVTKPGKFIVYYGPSSDPKSLKRFKYTIE